MNWRAFAEQFKECGRNGTLFVVALVVLWPVVGLATEIVDALGRWATPVLAGIWLALAAAAGFSFVQTWRHPLRLGKFPPLSQNDLNAARSKLFKHRASR